MQNVQQKPHRFGVSSPLEQITFHGKLTMDLLWLDHNPMLYTVCTHTRHGNTIWVESETAQGIWLAFLDCWSTVYISHLNRIGSDKEPAARSNFFQDLAKTQGIEFQLLLTEANNATGIGNQTRIATTELWYSTENLPSTIATYFPTISHKRYEPFCWVKWLIPSLLSFGVIPTAPATIISSISKKDNGSRRSSALRK